MKKLSVLSLLAVSLGGFAAPIWAQLDLPTPQTPPPTLGVETVAQVSGQPIFAASSPGDDRLFIVLQQGQILIVEDGELLPDPFLDIADLLTTNFFERGLLGLAFHPEYEENGRFYVNYTGEGGHTRIAEYRVSSDSPNVADPDSAQVLLTIEQPNVNHNGGWIGFGPDGLLYVGTGDGGGSNDPNNNGQNPATLLGKILRIDVDGGEGDALYGIPAGNPFAEAPEAWILGLRNPWRASFDGNDLYIGDVGQGSWEEISVVTTEDAGANLGWRIQEGGHCFPPSVVECDREGLVQPIYEYPIQNQPECTVIGGYVYRGEAIPDVQGQYFFGDWCSGMVRSLRYDGGTLTDVTDWSEQISVGRITSFGVDSQGELYITATPAAGGFSISNQGTVYKIVPVEADEGDEE